MVLIELDWVNLMHFELLYSRYFSIKSFAILIKFLILIAVERQFKLNVSYEILKPSNLSKVNNQLRKTMLNNIAVAAVVAATASASWGRGGQQSGYG